MKESREFFEELYRSEYENMKRYVRRVVVDVSGIEDIVQETFYEAYRRRGELQSHPNLPGWLRITARNKTLKWEEKRRKYALVFDLLPERASETEREVDEFQMVEAYSTVCRILSQEELKILRYYYEYGYTSQEMAERLGITRNCFKVRIMRMKEKIRDHLKN